MLRKVTFVWDDTYGNCYDCGRPAAFLSDSYNNWMFGINILPHERRCAVCAANDACDGVEIMRIDVALGEND